MPDAPPDRPPWWRDRNRRNRVALVVFGGLALTGTVFAGVATQLLAGDTRVLIVTMAQDAGQPEREALKRACGDLPSVSVVPDQGDPDPRLQGRFSVRFALAGATVSQESALTECVQAQPGVRGFLVRNEG